MTAITVYIHEVCFYLTHRLGGRRYIDHRHWSAVTSSIKNRTNLRGGSFGRPDVSTAVIWVTVLRQHIVHHPQNTSLVRAAGAWEEDSPSG